jgi:hypothetical protein
MRAAFSKRNRAVSLIELVVASFIVSLISVAAFKILAEGLRYVRINQLAIDAQRSGLAIASLASQGIQSSRSDLIDSSPDGLVFASPTKDDGTVEFDIAEQELLWQDWVCLYYADGQVTLRKIPISPPSLEPGPPPVPSSFAGEDVRKLLGTDVSEFSVVQVSTVPPLWSVDLTIGSMTNESLYGMELRSEVGSRN